MAILNRETQAGRSSYHHGDLRRDLLRLARERIALGGAKSLSMSALARLAGVSQPAPYRHFAHLNALLEAVAAEAFGGLRQRLERAMAGCDPRDALAALARTYLAFGEAETEVYRLMFASRLTPLAAAGGELDRAAGAAFAMLRGAVAAVSTVEEIDRAAYRIWGQLHGLVMLKADGFLVSPLDSFIADLSVDRPTLLPAGNRDVPTDERG